MRLWITAPLFYKEVELLDYEVVKNASKTYVFRKMVEAGAEGYLSATLVSHGFVTAVQIRFAPGEAATLQIRPVMVIPGEISIDLLEYADNGDFYVSGDDETIRSDIRFEIENKTELRVYYKNTGDAESFVNVDIQVTYFQFAEPVNVIGPPSKRGLF